MEASKLLSKHPGRVPVILKKRKGDGLPDVMENNKLLVPGDMPASRLICIIRQNLSIPPQKALFILTQNGRLLNTSSFVSDIYLRERSKDGFLNLTYASENAFGSPITAVRRCRLGSCCRPGS
jgi:microtubule-associated protein 1 light chain